MQQLDLLTYPARPGFKERGGTSEEAAASIAPEQRRLQDRVLAVLRDFPNGLTADEVANYLDRSELAIRPRLSELLRLGEIDKTERRRRNRSGRFAAIYQAKRQ